MLLIGVTGGPGSGKTTVARMFQDLGVPTLPYDPKMSLFWHTLKLTLLQGYSYALVDLPLPAPPPLPFIEKRLLITCEKDLQLQRIMEARALSEKDSQALLLLTQVNEDDTIAPPASSIDNSSSFSDTREQVLSLHEASFAFLGNERKLGALASFFLILLALVKLKK